MPWDGTHTWNGEKGGSGHTQLWFGPCWGPCLPHGWSVASKSLPESPPLERSLWVWGGVGLKGSLWVPPTHSKPPVTHEVSEGGDDGPTDRGVELEAEPDPWMRDERQGTMVTVRPWGRGRAQWVEAMGGPSALTPHGLGGPPSTQNQPPPAQLGDTEEPKMALRGA